MHRGSADLGVIEVGQPRVSLARDEADLTIGLSGDWLLASHVPSTSELEGVLDSPPLPRLVRFDCTGLGDWDSALLAPLTRVLERCRERRIEVDAAGLPEGLRRLAELALAVPEKKDAKTEQARPPALNRLGSGALSVADSTLGMVDFLGQVSVAFGGLLRGRARFRRSDLGLLLQQAGADALPIVSLVTFLLGLILAFVGAIQLQQFGASIYVANLVGIAMVRDMAALMTGIVMTGRSGAAYAAQLGSMAVNEEIDALVTTGLSPIEFLVMPRVLALTLMLPLLTLYADLLGILGGAVVGTSMLHISWTEYTLQTIRAIQISHLLGGMFKGAVYGSLIGLAGCLRGMQARRSAAGVGDATTSAVVTGIVAIIAACGLFAYLWYILGL